MSKVLLVDDSILVRSVLNKLISSWPGYQIAGEAGNGKKGVEMAMQLNPDLILMDVNMPVMDGWDFINELRDEYESAGKSQGIPVIALSATGGEKGILFMRRSVVKGRNVNYSPLISVAKETCLNPEDYDAAGQEGLDAWLKFFLTHST